MDIFGIDNEFESDDSFFDDPRLSKKPVKGKTTEKKAVNDIFGFEDDKKVAQSVQSSLETKPKVRFNVEETKSSENIDQTTGTSKSSLSSKGLDWLGTSDDSDFAKKDSSGTKTSQKTDDFDDILSSAPSKVDSKRSFDLLDDILPQRGQKSDQKKTTSFEDILKESKAQKSGPSSLEKNTLEPRSGPGSFERTAGRQKADAGSLEGIVRGPKTQKDSSDGPNLILEPPKSNVGARRGRRGSNAGMTDILGLFGSGPSSGDFSNEPKKAVEGRAIEKKRGQDIPDWLGDGTTNKSDTTIISQKTDTVDNETTISQEIKHFKSSSLPKNVEIPEETSKFGEDTHDTRPTVSQTVSRTETSSIDNFQTSMSNLQTQESFLLVSLQLKKYESSLTDIKKQQDEILKKQENQFDRFLNTYIEKQKQIEHEMLGQQERINEHIRLLALQNFDSERSYSTQNRQKHLDSRDYSEYLTDNDDTKDDNPKTEIVGKIVQELKQRHDEEYFIMEESYKKQLSLLEKSSEQLENRLKHEIEHISKTYEENVEKIKNQHSEELKFWIEKIKHTEDVHRAEIDNIRENQTRVISEIKNEFLDQVERFKENASRESELFSNSADLSQKLSVSIEKLGKKEQILENLQEKVVSDYSVLSAAREISIQNKEKEIAQMREALDKCRAQAEKERSQLLALVRTLEQKISEQGQNAQEERWALQQAAATLAARASAFDREVEFSRASIEREREQLKTLKETLLADQERLAMQLTEEKLKLTAEKSRMEVSAKLVSNYEVEKIKTEAETAIQVAKELTDKLNMEKNFVQRQKIELDNFRSKLVEKERDLLEREEYVEELKRTMQQKNNEDRRVIQEARFLETRYKEKLSELQAQAMSLSSREKKLAEEKLLVSRERVGVYTSMKSQSGHNKCRLCKAEEENLIKSDLFFLGQPALDTELMRLRIEAAEDDRNSEVSKEEPSLKVV